MQLKKNTPYKAWDVYLHNALIDTVFYDSNCDKDYVKLSLINHDGYNPNIVLIGTKRYEPLQGNTYRKI